MSGVIEISLVHFRTVARGFGSKLRIARSILILLCRLGLVGARSGDGVSPRLCFTSVHRSTPKTGCYVGDLRNNGARRIAFTKHYLSINNNDSGKNQGAMMPATGELIRMMNYVDDIAAILRRVNTSLPTMSEEEKLRLAEYIRKSDPSLESVLKQLEKQLDKVSK